jgi:hypothetical protein
MACANTWGLVIMVICLGFSVVAVPQGYLKGADLDGSFKIHCTKAYKSQKDEEKLLEELRLNLRQIHKYYQGENLKEKTRKKLEKILQSIPNNIMELFGNNLRLAQGGKTSSEK